MKAIGFKARGVDTRLTAAVRLRVDSPQLRDDVLGYLRASSCLAVKHGSSEIDAHLLNSVSERHDRAVVLGLVESWKARHASSSVDIHS